LFKIKSKIPDFERGKIKILTTGIILNSFLILSQQGAFARSPAAALQENSAHLLSNVAKD